MTVVPLADVREARPDGGSIRISSSSDSVVIFPADEAAAARWGEVFDYLGIGLEQDVAGAASGISSCEVLGGWGWPIAAGERVQLRYGSDGLALHYLGQEPIQIPYEELVGFTIGGPGEVSSGGGFMGGGFGVKGAVEGIAIASILNRLTTKSGIITTIQVESGDAEIFLLYDQLGPDALRIALSAVFVRRRQHFGAA